MAFHVHFSSHESSFRKYWCLGWCPDSEPTDIPRPLEPPRHRMGRAGLSVAKPNRLWSRTWPTSRPCKRSRIWRWYSMCSPKGGGVANADRMTTDLVPTAFEMALWQGDVIRNRLIHHSDKVSPNTHRFVHRTPHRRRRGRVHRISR